MNFPIFKKAVFKSNTNTILFKLKVLRVGLSSKVQKIANCDTTAHFCYTRGR